MRICVPGFPLKSQGKNQDFLRTHDTKKLRTILLSFRALNNYVDSKARDCYAHVTQTYKLQHLEAVYLLTV